MFLYPKIRLWKAGGKKWENGYGKKIAFSISEVHCRMPQFAKQFYVIEENYVIFYAKFVIDDQVGLRIINVFQNILLINK